MKKVSKRQKLAKNEIFPQDLPVKQTFAASIPLSEAVMEWVAQEDHDFRDSAYIVSLSLESSSFTVQVESKETADQWRGQFDKSYVEELTHKTGNFKQFDIFVSMLENAIMEASESVSLDLLTYSDLESLRSQKGPLRANHQPGRKNELNSKRYLILVYSVEYDRIHYPLPLPYMGKPDPVALQEEIRQLKQQLGSSSVKPSISKPSRIESQEVSMLQREITKLKGERDSVCEEFDLFKQEVKKLTNQSLIAKEVKVLKGVIKNLEGELLREKAKHQKAINKLTQDYNKLLDEIEETKSSERSLRAKVKSLTNELNLLRRLFFADVQSFRPSHNNRSRQNSPRMLNSSRESGSHRSSQTSAFQSRQSRSRERVPVTVPVSNGRIHTNRSRERSLERENKMYSMTSRSRSNSPNRASNSKPRFDPTAFIREQAEKRRENDVRRSRERLPQSRRQRSQESTGRGRSNSMDRISFRAGILSGDESDTSVRSNTSQRSKASVNRSRVATTTLNSSRSRRMASTPEKTLRSGGVGGGTHHADLHLDPPLDTSSHVFNQSTDLEDIDARLNALQEFMKLNL